MELNRIQSIFFLGAGGIGMSALARYCLAKGMKVLGYDKTPSPITKALQNEGASIFFDDDPSMLTDDIGLVVYTPAVPVSTALFKAIVNKNLPMVKRAKMLGLLTKDKKTIAIAGTHGKTTISTMVAHILKSAGFKATAFLGGISTNYGTNYLADEPSDWVVVEADEFDRSFLELEPDIALITAIDADHLDIYGNEEALRSSFREFAARIKPGGILIKKRGLEITPSSNVKTLQYHLHEPADVYSKGIEVKNGAFHAGIGGLLKCQQFSFGLPGRHNIENALGAALVADLVGVDENTIALSLSSFLGVKRRFEQCYEGNGWVVIDDYAHHPEEIRVSIEATRELHPGKELTVVFQPHLFSRTRDLAEGFAASLGMADRLLLLDIYPARELPIEGITSKWLLDKIYLKEKHLLRKEDLPRAIATLKPGALLIMGAGDIDRVVGGLVETLKKTGQ
ncbi:MAG TPA: UDP-N-acetylmuramate--L-alanine ligase [Bacteroidales bacterium]|nr:UDP-N-acetylmuramate--L-alanine ligase [Bacteroidales bacterium]